VASVRVYKTGERLRGARIVGASAGMNADVVIAGGGVAGCAIANELASAGLKVLVLESGPSVERGTAVTAFRNAIAKVPESAYPDVPYAPRPSSLDIGGYYVQGGPDTFSATSGRRCGCCRATCA
jgi:choline dehydrogenase-like flavoprotein